MVAVQCLRVSAMNSERVDGPNPGSYNFREAPEGAVKPLPLSRHGALGLDTR